MPTRKACFHQGVQGNVYYAPSTFCSGHGGWYIHHDCRDCVKG